MKAIRLIAILLLVGATIIGTLFYTAANYSQVTMEFTCVGETKFGDVTAEADNGRLQISEYTWIVSLWNDTSDGNAIFQSTKFAFYESELDQSGDGNFSNYMGLSKGQEFIFQRATGQLGIRHAGVIFTGKCNLAR